MQPIQLSKLVISCLFFILATVDIFAAIELEVYSKDEAVLENNIIKPRIYIKNTGTETLNGFIFYYLGASEDGKTSVVEPWWCPGATITSENLDNGVFKIQYSCSGVQLKPGEIYPDPAGNVIGIHYSDYSNVNKSNDYSNPASGSFTLTNTIPVYSISGQLVSGLIPDTISILPQLPIINEEPIQSIDPRVLFEYAILSSEKTFFNDRSSYTGYGLIGSRNLIEVGLEATLKGDLYSGGNIAIKDRTRIEGNISAAGSIILINSPVITGDQVQNASITLPDIQQKGLIPFGNDSIFIGNHLSRTLQPGNYADLFAFSNSEIILSEGVYNFKSINLESDVDIKINAQSGKNVEINVEGLIRFGDRTEIYKNAAFPANIQIYSNYTGTINIGCNCRLFGILNAPFAEVRMFSNASLTGGIYSKIFSTEPDVMLAGDPVDPIADFDDDIAPNYVERLFNTRLNDAQSYPLFAYSDDGNYVLSASETCVNYNFSMYSDYSESGSIPVIISGDVIGEGLAPIVYVSNTPSENASPFASETYRKIGRYINYTGTINLNKSVSVAIPFPDNTHLIPEKLKVAHFEDNAWIVLSPDSVTGNGVYVTVSSFSPFIIVSEDTKTTAYIDGFGVLSENPGIQINVDVAITGVPETFNSTASKLNITYIKNGIEITKPIDILSSNGNSIARTSFTEIGPITVNSITIDLPGTEYDNSLTSSLELNNGDYFSIELSTVFDDYINSEIEGDKIILRQLFSGVRLEYSMTGDIAIIPVYDEHENVTSFTYNYYLKDHLGSTRAVIDDQGNLTEATLFKAYGNMSSLHTGTDVKEKFTGKEFDDEGTNNGAPGIGQFYFQARNYDPEIGIFTSVDPAEQFWNRYTYTSGNPINLTDPTGMFVLQPTEEEYENEQYLENCNEYQEFRQGYEEEEYHYSVSYVLASYYYTKSVEAGHSSDNIERFLSKPINQITHYNPSIAIPFKQRSDEVGLWNASVLWAEDHPEATITFDIATTFVPLSLPVKGTKGVQYLDDALRFADDALKVGEDVFDVSNNLRVYETLFEAPITGVSRSAHRASANKYLASQLQSSPELTVLLNEQLGADVLSHMQSGRNLRNPPGTVWHHPSDRIGIMYLLRETEHTNPLLQEVLHKYRIGGYGLHYGN